MLHLYTNGTETYVADSADHAARLHFELCEVIDSEWDMLDDEEDITVLFEVAQSRLPEGATAKEVKIFGESYHRATAKASSWAIYNGPGFLCSTEW